ncbi:MAG: T9SS type A sorting domain-containing protein, partial [Bacteroidota bacterium]
NRSKDNTIIQWTDPLTWGSQLPKDTMDISVAYPGLYDQLEVQLNLTALNSYCNTNICDGDVTSQRNVTVMDSAKMTVTGSGAWNVNGILSVNGDLIIDADSTATITIGELQVGGKLIIPAGKNPTIIINGGFVCSGTLEPGRATIILNGENMNFVSAPAFGADTTKRTLEIYNLVMNSDSTMISDNVKILNQLTLNSDIRFADSLNDFFDAYDTLFIASTSPNAIIGTGSMKSGIIKRTIDQSEPGTYRFHTPATTVQITSTENLPSSLTMMRIAGTVPANQYLAVKEGTVNNESKSVAVNSVSPLGFWGFGSPEYQDGDARGGPFYTITAEGAQSATGNISLGYEASLLNGLDESALALLKVSSGIRVRNIVDMDGDVESDSDRVTNTWEVKIYKGSVAEENLLATQSSEEILLDDVKSGDYIIVPSENIHFRTIQRTVSGHLFVDSSEAMSVTVPDGVLMDIVFVRKNVVMISAEAGANGVIIPSGITEVATNSVVEYNIIPDFGYRIEDVLVDGISVGSSDVFVFEGVGEDHEISATFVYDDNILFRTFAADVNLSKKATKLTYKKGVLVSPPNIATAVEAAFKKLGKNGATFIGIPQTVKADAKKYAWITYKKAADLGKLYTSAHSNAYYPIDTLRGVKKNKALVGVLKPDRKTYNNKTFEQAVAFKLNLLASQDSITPPNFGALTLDTTLTLAGKDLYGMTLSEIGMYLDTAMTYWKDKGIDDDTARAELGTVTEILKRINDGFSASLSATNHTVGSALIAKKNPYAVTLEGVKRASDVKLVKLVPGKRSTRFTQLLADERPKEYQLYQNYPNPFNPTTTIRFDLPQASNVTLKIYNILGQEITTLLHHQEYEDGQYEVLFDASMYATGVYFYRLSINNDEFTQVKKFMLLK